MMSFRPTVLTYGQYKTAVGNNIISRTEMYIEEKGITEVQADLFAVSKISESRKWPYKKLLWYKSFTLIKAGVGKSMFSIASPRYEHRRVKEDLS